MYGQPAECRSSNDEQSSNEFLVIFSHHFLVPSFFERKQQKQKI
jgi:hypothetical protein